MIIKNTYFIDYLGAADLEKVTDYAEEKEIGSSSAAEDAIAVISNYLSTIIKFD